MNKVLVVTSSVREGRAADNVLKFVSDQLSKRTDVEMQVADLKDLTMPFFDAPTSPSSEDFLIDNENVKKWTQMVGEADSVLFLVAEYNHSMTGVLKNAIDWIYKEWNGKPVTFVGYGWVGGARAIAALRVVMNSTLSAKPTENEVNLHFTKEIDLTGAVIDEEKAAADLHTTLEELFTRLG